MILFFFISFVILERPMINKTSPGTNGISRITPTPPEMTEAEAPSELPTLSAEKNSVKARITYIKQIPTRIHPQMNIAFLTGTLTGSPL